MNITFCRKSLDVVRRGGAFFPVPSKVVKVALVILAAFTCYYLKSLMSFSRKEDISNRDAKKPPEPILLTNKKQYYALLEDNQLEGNRPMIIPERRICPIGPTISISTWKKIKAAQFILPEEIIEVHAMHFLRNSPFADDPEDKQMIDRTLDGLDNGSLAYLDEYKADSMVDSLKKRVEGIGRTQDGRHVILQQAAKSCVPSCVAMLVLDRGKMPNYRAIERIHIANRERAIQWIQEAGLSHQFTDLTPFWENNQTELASQLSDCLQAKGSGILGIDHPVIGGHVIVLDEISKENKTARIRDSFHGWALTIRLEALLSWKPDYLIQVF